MKEVGGRFGGFVGMTKDITIFIKQKIKNRELSRRWDGNGSSVMGKVKP